MKILIISYIYPPEVQGTGIMVRELSEALAAGGHQVTVQTGWPNHPQGKLYPGYKMKWRHMERDGSHDVQRIAMMIANKSSNIKRLGVYSSFAASSFVNGLSLGRHDVVVSLSTPIIGVWTAWALARLWKAKYVNIIFDLWPEVILNAGRTKNNWLYNIIRNIDTLNCKCSDAISVLSQGMKDQVVARGISPDGIEIIPTWIDTDRIKPMSNQNNWRRDNNIPPEKFIVLYSGTIGHVSGAEILIDTAQYLKEKKDILLLIVGDGVAKSELQRLADENKTDNIRFMPFQPEESLCQMQATADVSLVTLLPKSGATSVPCKILTYMAAGRPVIASVDLDCATARFVNGACCGLTCPAQDPKALADCILDMYSRKEFRLECGINARKCAEEQFSRHFVIKQYEKLICHE